MRGIVPRPTADIKQLTCIVFTPVSETKTQQDLTLDTTELRMLMLLAANSRLGEGHVCSECRFCQIRHVHTYTQRDKDKARSQGKRKGQKIDRPRFVAAQRKKNKRDRPGSEAESRAL